MLTRIFFSFFLLAMVGCAPRPNLSGLLGQEAPLVRFTSLDGLSRSTYEFKGKTIVITFWAEWCMFSKPVIEELNELAARDRTGQTIFIAVSIDPATSYKRLQQRIEKQQLVHLEHAFSGNALLDDAYQTLKGQELPHVFVISPDGRIIAEGHDAEVAEEGVLAATEAG